MKKVKELDPRVKTGVIFREAPINLSRLALDSDAENLYAFHGYITWEMAQHVHGHGLKIYAWTVDEPSTIENLIMLGVDGIVTNKPDIKF